MVTFVTAVLLLEIPQIESAIALIKYAVDAISAASLAGTSFVFGYIGGGPAPFATTSPANQFVLAFQALPIVLVMSVLTTLLFYWRILPLIVRGFSWALERTLGVGGAVGLSTAANIFIGMVEAPLFVRPYLNRLARGELFMIMTGGMATIAGTVFVLYATILRDVIPDAAGHLLIASIISAPAALLVSQLMVPVPEDERTDIGAIEIGPVADNTMDAIVRGTAAGLELLLNIVAMLIVLVALVHLANAILGLLPDMAGSAITLQRLLGYVMAPVCWLMGIPWHQAVTAGSLMGIKTVLNELIAYIELAKLPAERARSALAADHALRPMRLRQFRLARHHACGADRDGAGAPRRHHLARRQVDRVGRLGDLHHGRYRRGAQLVTRPDEKGTRRNVFRLPLLVPPRLPFQRKSRPRRAPSTSSPSATASPPAICCRVNEAYPAQLQARLRAKGYDVVVKNAGIGGDTAKHALKRFDTAIDPGTDICILEFGINDRRQRRLDQDRARPGRRTDAQPAGARHPRAGARRRRAQDGQARRRQGALYVDWTLPKHKYRARDHAHFNAEGYSILVTRMLPQVETLIRQVQAAPNQ